MYITHNGIGLSIEFDESDVCGIYLQGSDVNLWELLSERMIEEIEEKALKISEETRNEQAFNNWYEI